MAIKSPLGRQLGTQFDSVFDVVKSNPMYDKSGGNIPSLDLNFANSKSLRDSRSTKNLINFVRASTGTYVGSDGLIKTSPVNLLPYSDYSQTDGTTDAQLEGVVAAPDGTITARRYSVPSAGLDAINKSSTAGTDGKDYTFSVWVRSTGTASEVRLIVGDPAVNALVQISTQWQRFEITKINNASNFVRGYVQMLNVGDEVEVWGAQAEEGTTATDYIPTGATKSGAPRFDHDPVTGESLGLLIEEVRTNLVVYSKTPPMTPVGADPPSISTVSNQVLPSGEIGSVKFVVYGSGDSRARLSVSGSFTGNYRGSIYWKLKDGGTWTRINRGASNTGSFLYTDFAPANLGIPDGSEVYFTFAQTELGSFPTSYIPTSGSAVTRSPDIATIEGTNFSSWYNQSEGTVFVELGSEQGGVPARFQLSDDSGVNRIQSRKNQLYCFNGTQQFNLSYTSSLKEASAVSGTSTSVAASGSVVATHGSASLPTCTNMELGKRGGNFDYLNGHIARLAYFPTRISDQKLVKMTS
jgi:hypothetical protein